MEANSTVEIFAIGSELVSGLIQDTNSCYLAAHLTELGGEVTRITVLPDDAEVMLEAFGSAVSRGAAVALVCGGLGPTPDDMTVEVFCRFLGVESKLDEPLLAEFMARRGFTSREQVTPNLLKMATVPAGSRIHTNPEGWAPCIEVARQETTFFVLPGPPRELQGLFSMHLAGVLAERFNTRRASKRVLVDMHESEVSPHLEAVMAEFPRTYLKAYVALRKSHAERLPVDIACVGDDESDAAARVDAAAARLNELVSAQGKTLTADDEPS